MEVLKATNSKPIELLILEKSDGVLVDNKLWKVISSTRDDLFAKLEQPDLIETIIVSYKYGSIVYNKIFNGVGKQNTISFVGNCEQN